MGRPPQKTPRDTDSTARSYLAITTPGRLHATAMCLLNPTVLLENLLTIRHSAIYLLGRSGGEKQSGLCHMGNWLTTRIVKSWVELVVDRARCGDHL